MGLKLKILFRLVSLTLSALDETTLFLEAVSQSTEVIGSEILEASLLPVFPGLPSLKFESVEEMSLG